MAELAPVPQRLKLQMPAATPELSTRLGLFKYLGPGLIMASASIGSGEIFFSSRGGAIFGYALLWTFALCAILKGVVIYSGARYITLTGESPFTRFGQVIPGPKNWFPVVLGILAVVCFPAWCASFATFMGNWSVWTFGFGHVKVWATVWIVLAFSALFYGGYKYVERFQSGIVIMVLVFVIIAVFVAHPDWLDVIRGMIPVIPDSYAPWVQTKLPELADKPISLEVISYLGAIGGGTYDYIGYIGMYHEKKWGMLASPDLKELRSKIAELKKGERIEFDQTAENEKNIRLWMRAPIMDSTISFIAVLIFSAAFMILGNVILGENGNQSIPNDKTMMEYQAAFFSQITPALVYFYKLAVWAAFFGSMQASGTIMYAHTFYECFSMVSRWVRETNFFNVRLLVAFIYSGGGLILMWSGLSFTTLVSFAGIVGGVFSIGLWGLAMLYTDTFFLPKKHQMHLLTKIVLGISGATLTVLGLVAFLQFFNVL